MGRQSRSCGDDEGEVQLEVAAARVVAFARREHLLKAAAERSQTGHNTARNTCKGS